MKLSVAKFGGGLLDREGRTIPLILKRIKDLRKSDGFGPIAIFSAPQGYTDELIRAGESRAQSRADVSIDPLFENYEKIARRHVKAAHQERVLSELQRYRSRTEEALGLVDRRFSGSVRARVLTNGGELPTSVLIGHILESEGLDSCHVSEEYWPVVTDDDFENATPILEEGRTRVKFLTEPLEEGKTVSMAGFLGVTTDGLETVLGRGGSDLTAVFVSSLLKTRYDVETLLFKEVSVQSADPKIVNGQTTEHITSLTYNEAHKASMMGMKIVQNTAIRAARNTQQTLRIVPIDNPGEYTLIQPGTPTGQTVKCVTGKTGCAILSTHDQNSRSLEDSLRIWEGVDDFLELGTETLETGERIRDLLFMDTDFLRRNEERLRGFDEGLSIEYGVGVVTLIGDGMKDSPGIASAALAAIPDVNVKRAVFAPHTSLIILAVDERNVKAAVAAIHRRRQDMNHPTRKREQHSMSSP